jgi:hypothetical protein
LRELYSLATASFYIEIYTPGDVLLQVSNSLCLFSWGFMEHCIELSNGGALAYFLVSRWDSGSIKITSASYYQDIEIYPLFHIGQGGLATKAVTILNCSHEVTIIPDVDQLLLLLQCVWFFGTNMNLYATEG